MSHLPSSPQHSAGHQLLLVGVSGLGWRLAKTLPKGDTAQSGDQGAGSGAPASPIWAARPWTWAGGMQRHLKSCLREQERASALTLTLVCPGKGTGVSPRTPTLPQLPTAGAACQSARERPLPSFPWPDPPRQAGGAPGRCMPPLPCQHSVIPPTSGLGRSGARGGQRAGPSRAERSGRLDRAGQSSHRHPHCHLVHPPALPSK